MEKLRILNRDESLSISDENESMWGDVPLGEEYEKVRKKAKLARTPITFSNNLASIEEEIEEIALALEANAEITARLMLRDQHLKEIVEREYLLVEGITNVPELFQKRSRAQLLEDQIIKIELDFNLPYYTKSRKNKTSYYEAIKRAYTKFIGNALREGIPYELKPKFEHAFILIVHTFRKNMIRDFDNYAHSFVFNAIRNNQFLTDDAWQNITYMEIGRLETGISKTEIFFGDVRKKNQIYSLANGEISDITETNSNEINRQTK